MTLCSNLPVPISVNKRRQDRTLRRSSEIKAWTRAANALTMAAWSGGKRPKVVLDRFEVTIILSEDCDKD